MPHTGPGEIVRKYIIHQIVNIFKNVSSVNPLLVVCGGRGYGEIVSLVSIPRNQWISSIFSVAERDAVPWTNKVSARHQTRLDLNSNHIMWLVDEGIENGCIYQARCL